MQYHQGGGRRGLRDDVGRGRLAVLEQVDGLREVVDLAQTTARAVLSGLRSGQSVRCATKAPTRKPVAAA